MPAFGTLRSVNKKPQMGASAKSINESQKSINKIANTVVAKMKIYPPKEAGQKYRRTGNLSRSWRTTRGFTGGDHYQINIVNDVTGKDGPYAGAVQGVHSGSIGTRQSLYFESRGWSSIEDVLNEEYQKNLPEIRRSFRRRAP